MKYTIIIDILFMLKLFNIRKWFPILLIKSTFEQIMLQNNVPTVTCSKLRGLSRS